MIDVYVISWMGLICAEICWHIVTCMHLKMRKSFNCVHIKSVMNPNISFHKLSNMFSSKYLFTLCNALKNPTTYSFVLFIML